MNKSIISHENNSLKLIYYRNIILPETKVIAVITSFGIFVYCCRKYYYPVCHSNLHHKFLDCYPIIVSKNWIFHLRKFFVPNCLYLKSRVDLIFVKL